MEATEYFMNGYSCSESVIKWAIDNGLVEPSLLSVATAFSGGMGSGCLCGAISASQMIIGSIYGRENKFGNEVIARAKAKEFMNKFLEKHKATCCRVLTRGMEMVSPERKAHCANMVEECVKLIQELVEIRVGK